MARTDEDAPALVPLVVTLICAEGRAHVLELQHEEHDRRNEELDEQGPDQGDRQVARARTHDLVRVP
eukprot:CAMPEP_0168357494 /NCGR_PEP_ID=MMETSP0228-20121227/618_1 /TAXON_ID=133427 /ORGANISM="Protoceratium reticulatum, Strain CCCM 535 (=CCMP 1889)" /LENGTH=66 /DNA_ID=CAMNT_0008370019 /DNA_START=142 /DNA_END=340 /DNA_ORIENTATION=+